MGRPPLPYRTRVVCVRMKPDRVAALDAIARRQETSRSRMLSRIIDGFIAASGSDETDRDGEMAPGRKKA